MYCVGPGSPAQGQGLCQSEPGVNVKASWAWQALLYKEMIELSVSIGSAPLEAIMSQGSNMTEREKHCVAKYFFIKSQFPPPLKMSL